MTIEVRPARPEEYDETGRVTALAYREFADGESWEQYLELIADVGARADIAVVLAAVEDGRILGSATLELDRRIEDDDPQLPPELLPGDWPGAAAYDLCRDVYHAAEAPSRAHLAAVLADAGDALLPAFPEFLTRFA